MNQGYLMIAFLMIIALMPAAALRIVNRKETTGRMTFFFFFCNYFLGSAVKWYLGSPENTLAQSFWDMGRRTYLHYGLVVLFADAVLFACVLGIQKRWGRKIFEVFDAGMLLLLLIAGFCRGSVTNAVYCILFAASAGFSGLFVLCNKKEITFYTRREYGKAFWEAAPAVGAWIITVGIFLPNELYISNAGEFAAPYREFFWILMSGSLIVGLFLMVAAVLLLPREFYKPFALAGTGVSIMTYIQGSFLNGKLHELTGEEQMWPAGVRLANALIWIAVIGMIVIGGSRKAVIGKICRGACIYIALIEIATLGYLLVTKDNSNARSQEAMTTQEALMLAEDENIVVFILDAFDSSYFDTILDENAEFVQPLADFTYYSDAASQYAHTSTAIPYLLEGVDVQEDGTSTRTDALMSLHRQGYELGIYTEAYMLSDGLLAATANYREDIERKSDYGNTITVMLRTSMYKTAPFAIKSRYVYSEADIDGISRAREAWNIYNDLPFYQMLKSDGLTVNAGCKSAFRFYHMAGAHAPFCLTEDMQYDKTGREGSLFGQAKASLKIVYEYLEQMKALGKYDSATIIITTDHGQTPQNDLITGEMRQPSAPLMLVKEAGSHQAVLAVNEAPVAQSELMPTILKAAGIDWAKYGRTFSEVADDEERERTYKDVYFKKEEGGYQNYYIEYLIEGDVKNINNWSVNQVVYY